MEEVVGAVYEERCVDDEISSGVRAVEWVGVVVSWLWLREIRHSAPMCTPERCLPLAIDFPFLANTGSVRRTRDENMRVFLGQKLEIVV